MMQHPIIHALTGAALGQSHSVADSLPHLGGMLIVILALMALWGLTVLIGKLVGLLPSAPPPAVTSAAVPQALPSPAPAPSSAADDSSVSPEIAAVIAAAVTVTTAGTRRVISVRPADSAWERAGRHSILTSHRIR